MRRLWRALILGTCVTVIIAGLFYPLNRALPDTQSLYMGGIAVGAWSMYLIHWYYESLDSAIICLEEYVETWVKNRVHTIGTDAKKDTFERLALRIPDRLWDPYSRGSVYLMWFFIAIWVGLIILLVINVGHEIVTSFHMTPEPSAESISPPTVSDIFTAAPVIVRSILITYLLYLAFLLFLLPGIILHEFGHFCAGVRAGLDVEEYGAIFIGPVPMGAYVAFEDRWVHVIDKDTAKAIASAGIINNLVWGIILLLAALLLALPVSGAPVLSIEITNLAFPQQPHEAYVMGVTFLAVLGSVELAMAISNAFPFWRVDGGLFRRLHAAPLAEFTPPNTLNHATAEGI